MVEIALAESAWQDLESIADYIAKDSPRYAQEFGGNVLDRIEQLKGFPRSGRVVPEFKNNDIRELIYGRYRIVYRIYSDTQIVVLRIVHGAKFLNYR